MQRSDLGLDDSFAVAIAARSQVDTVSASVLLPAPKT
jgi:hypothetical protein